MKITILEELKNLIPPLSPQEYRNLEASILKDGLLSPLIFWANGDENILIDGHNRYEICLKNKEEIEKFEFIKMDFHNLDEVKQWIIQHQQSRRNINKLTRAYLIGEEYNLLKKDRSQNFLLGKGRELTEFDKKFIDSTTSQKLSIKYKESESTIKRYAKLSKHLSNENLNELKASILQSDVAFGTVLEFCQLLEDKDYNVNLSKLMFDDIEKVIKKTLQDHKPPKVQNDTLDNDNSFAQFVKDSTQISDKTLSEVSKALNSETAELKAQIEGLQEVAAQYLERGKAAEEKIKNLENESLSLLENLPILKYKELCEKGFNCYRADYTAFTLSTFDEDALTFYIIQTHRNKNQLKKSCKEHQEIKGNLVFELLNK